MRHTLSSVITTLLLLLLLTATSSYATRGDSPPDLSAVLVRCCPVKGHHGLHVLCKPEDRTTLPASKEPDNDTAAGGCVNSYSLLSSFVRLKGLDVSFNRISDIPDLSAPRVSGGLAFLDVSHNALGVLSRRALRGLSGLHTLNASHNRLAQLASDAFVDAAASLSLLDLSCNSLDALPPGLFDELVRLEALDVSGNGVESLHRLLFQHLASLRSLNLSGNALAELPRDVFRRLSALSVLDLSRNKLTSLPARDAGDGVFRGLAKLARLDLARNELKAVSKATFEGLEGLTHLDLSGNRLATLRKATFVTLTRLLWLSLKDNRLGRLSEDAFAGLRWLQFLDLSGNQLVLDQETFPADVFSPLRNLRDLRLSHNDPNTEGRYPEGVFNSLVELRHLSLDTFSSVEFGEDFTELTRIRTLDLPVCKAKMLATESFWGLDQSPLVSVRLDGCPLQEVEGCPFCRFTQLETLSVTNNRRSARSSSASPPANAWSGKLIGAAENAFLRAVNLSNATLPREAARALADLTLKNLDRLQVLDLSHNGLDDDGVRLEMKKSGGLKRVLLAGNKFRSVPLNVTDHRRLALLDLSDNDVSFLSPEQRSSLAELARASPGENFTLRLRGNPFPCPLKTCSDSADSVEFLSWLCPRPGEEGPGPTAAGGCKYSCAVTGEGETVSVSECLRACQVSSSFTHVTALLTAAAAAPLLVFLLVHAGRKMRRESTASTSDLPDVPAGGGGGRSSREESCQTVESCGDSATSGSLQGSGKSSFASASVEDEPSLHCGELLREFEEESSEESRLSLGSFPTAGSPAQFLADHHARHDTEPKRIDSLVVPDSLFPPFPARIRHYHHHHHLQHHHHDDPHSDDEPISSTLSSSASPQTAVKSLVATTTAGGKDGDDNEEEAEEEEGEEEEGRDDADEDEIEDEDGGGASSRNSPGAGSAPGRGKSEGEGRHFGFAPFPPPSSGDKRAAASEGGRRKARASLDDPRSRDSRRREDEGGSSSDERSPLGFRPIIPHPHPIHPNPLLAPRGTTEEESVERRGRRKEPTDASRAAAPTASVCAATSPPRVRFEREAPLSSATPSSFASSSSASRRTVSLAGHRVDRRGTTRRTRPDPSHGALLRAAEPGPTSGRGGRGGSRGRGLDAAAPRLVRADDVSRRSSSHHRRHHQLVVGDVATERRAEMGLLSLSSSSSAAMYHDDQFDTERSWPQILRFRSHTPVQETAQD